MTGCRPARSQRPNRHTPAARGRAALVLLALLLAGVAALLVHREGRWHQARALASEISPDGRWRIDGLSLAGDGSSALRLRVQRLPDDGSTPAVVSAAFVHGAYTPGWVCDAQGCTEFWWSARTEDRLALPPDAGARLRGWLLRALAP